LYELINVGWMDVLYAGRDVDDRHWDCTTWLWICNVEMAHITSFTSIEYCV